MKYIIAIVLAIFAALSYTGKASADPSEEQKLVMEAHTPAEMLMAAQARVDAHGGTLTAEEMQILLEFTGWGKASAQIAMRIAYCESRYSPYAIGDNGQSFGLFQLWRGWFSAFGYPLEVWSNIIMNATVARLTYERRGRFGGGGGWSCAFPGE